MKTQSNKYKYVYTTDEVRIVIGKIFKGITKDGFDIPERLIKFSTDKVHRLVFTIVLYNDKSQDHNEYWMNDYSIDLTKKLKSVWKESQLSVGFEPGRNNKFEFEIVDWKEKLYVK